jgi:hypothetical protein
LCQAKSEAIRVDWSFQKQLVEWERSETVTSQRTSRSGVNYLVAFLFSSVSLVRLRMIFEIDGTLTMVDVVEVRSSDRRLFKYLPVLS